MSSWLSLGRRKDDKGEDEHKGSAGDAPAPAPQPALDPDEVC